VVVGNPIINALFNNSNQDFIYTGFGANQNELIFRKKLSGNLTHYDFEIGDSKDSFNLNGGAIKGQDNDLNAITTFIGSILIISDTTKPTISSSSPANNIAGISTNTQIVFTFSENIVAASGNITIADSTNGTDDRIIPIADSQVDITNNILTITPSVALQANSFYKINIASSIVNDTASNFFTDNSSFPTTFSTDSGDIIAPILSSFVRKTPASAITDADVLIFTATFDEAVINVDAADFDVDSTSTTTITNVTEINSSTYDITVSGGDLASFNGTVALNVDGGQNITDSFGNPFAGAGPSANEIYTLDNDSPILSSFVRKTPASAITDADVLIFTATFDEAVINVDAADFDVDSTSTTTITNVTEINSSTYDITVSGGDLASFNGTVALNVDGGQNITDSFGNIFAGAEPVTDEIYTMDNASPILTSSTPADEALQVSRTASIVLVFDEEVSLDGQINLTDGGNKFGISDIRSFTNSTGAILSVDKKTITISLSGDSGNQRKLEYAEDYEITWSAGAITDSAGNAIVALNGNDLNFKTVDLEAGIILSQTVAQGDATFVTSSAKRNTITQSFIMSVDVDIDSAAAGLILECGGSGRGQYVGFGNGLFRVRGGLGNDSLVNLAGNDVVSIEAPFSNIPTEKTTLMVEYVTSVSAQTIRVWFDEMLLPISSIGSINSPTSGSAFAGAGDCFFASASTSVPRYESTSAFDRSVNGSFRFYDNQIIP
jgi:methionine-rich copper-binding protein CopC